MIYKLINILLLTGAIQGIIFSGFAFFSKKHKSRSSFFLGMLILTFSLNLIQNYMTAGGLISRDTFFDYFFLPLSSVYLPLYYLYVKSFLYWNLKLEKTDFLVLIPFGISFLFSVIEKLVYFFDRSGDRFEVLMNDYRSFNEIFNVAFSIFLILVSYRLIRKHESNLEMPGDTSGLRMHIDWLKSVTLILLILCLYWTVPLYFELNYDFELSKLFFYPLWLCLAVTIYLLGYIGLYRYSIRKEIENIKTAVSVSAVGVRRPTAEPVEKNANIVKFENYIREQKNYLNTGLSLESVAEEFGINPSYLSRIINSDLGMSFSDYINKLRVEEAKLNLVNPQFKNYNLISIGLEAGFNSKTSFYNSFRKFENMTPSEYRKLHLKSDIQ